MQCEGSSPTGAVWKCIAYVIITTWYLMHLFIQHLKFTQDVENNTYMLTYEYMYITVSVFPSFFLFLLTNNCA